MPATIEVCQRIRDGYPCLGRVHRSGVPEIVSCQACGSRNDGVVYHLGEGLHADPDFLKLRALLDAMSPAEQQRWAARWTPRLQRALDQATRTTKD